MKIQLKYILPYSVQTSPDFLLPSDLNLSDLKQKIADIFNLPTELQLLKIQKDHYYVKKSLSNNFLKRSKD